MSTQLLILCLALGGSNITVSRRELTARARGVARAAAQVRDSSQ